jgi:holdfast attachment protein HfaA
MARRTVPALRRPIASLIAVAGLIAGVLAAQAASAQSMNANSASFNAGFGRFAGEENRPVNIQTTDSTGNTTLVNGLIQPTAGSLFSEVSGATGGGATAGAGSSAGGAGDNFSGAGGGSSASAIGNSLNVIVQGDNNTVIVNATQNNTGAVTATSSSNGK